VQQPCTPDHGQSERDDGQCHQRVVGYAQRRFQKHERPEDARQQPETDSKYNEAQCRAADRPYLEQQQYGHRKRHWQGNQNG